jgi:hypothetical protein
MQIRQNITDIGGFALKQTVAMQMDPAPAKPKPLIDTHCNLAAGRRLACDRSVRFIRICPAGINVSPASYARLIR